jgi:hypothetical protein
MAVSRKAALIGTALIGVSALSATGVILTFGGAGLPGSNDMVKMNERDDLIIKPSKPKNVKFVQVKITGASDVIDISYPYVARASLANTTIESLLNKVMGGAYVPQWRAPKDFSEDDVQLSRLSLRNKFSTYIVFILDCKNCKFATDDHPFRVQRGKSRYHYDARVAWLTSGGPMHAPMPAPGAEAKHGYFIAYSDDDLSAQGGSRFRSNFNFYLELTYGNAKSVPISIDPDVGYPGGRALSDEP